MIPQVLYDTNLFMGGISFSGDVPSVTLPKITVKTDSFTRRRGPTRTKA